MKQLVVLSALALGTFALGGYAARASGSSTEVACGDHEKPASPTPAPAPTPKPKPTPKPAS